MDDISIDRAHDRTGNDPDADTPVAELSHTFLVDTTLSELWAFLRDGLGQVSLTAAELMGIDTTVANALTEIDDDTKTVTVSLRIFAHTIEVDVLLADTPPDTSIDPHVNTVQRHITHRYKRHPQ